MTIAYSGTWNPAGRNPAVPDLPGQNQAARSITIVGGGASGVLMAAHLLRSRDPRLEITIVEKRTALGRGLAYSTAFPDHLLNVRASNMSAFADDPDHFVRWIGTQGIEARDPATFFAPRRLYGEYLEQLLQDARQEGSFGRLKVVAQECAEIVRHDSHVELRLADGSSLATQFCILATGHDEKPCRSEMPATAQVEAGTDQVGSNDPILIVGTGLSMVDTCLSLLLAGHDGPIIALSRRGLLPAVHTKTAPVVFAQADIPLGADLSTFVRWFREIVQSTEARGGNWRDVVDGLRPFNQSIWQSWPDAAKRRFFRHMKAWWDIHRHRMAPQVHERLAIAIADGQLRTIAGRLLGVEQGPDGFSAKIQHRGSKRVEELTVARMYDCAGVIADPARSSNPVIRSLLQAGAARCDQLHIGLDVSPEGALIDRDGARSERIYAVGPLTRGAFLEIEAVPDIRVQCQKLAAALLQHAN